jgi:peptidoglycan hydrolase CwlO-like protein
MSNNEKTLEQLKEELKAATATLAAIQQAVSEKEAEEEKQRKEKLANEKEARKAEIEATEERLINLKAEFAKDYGSYSAVRTYSTSTRNIPDYLKWVFDEV